MKKNSSFAITEAVREELEGEYRDDQKHAAAE